MPQLDDDTGQVHCRSWGWVAADTGAAIGIATLTGYILAMAAGNRAIYETESCRNRNSDDIFGTGLFVVAGAFAASAVYGLFANDYCDSVKPEQAGGALAQPSGSASR